MQAITHIMEPVAPGRYTVLTVADADDTTCIYARPLADGDVDLPSAVEGRAPVAAWAGPVEEWTVVQRTGECLTVDVPDGPLHVFAVSLDPDVPLDTAWVVNRTRLDWALPSPAKAGHPLILHGRCTDDVMTCLAAEEEADDETPLPFGATRVVAVHRESGVVDEWPIEAQGAWDIHTSVPPYAQTGDYDIYAHNTLGGEAGWSDPMPLTVINPPTRAHRLVRFDELLERVGDVDDAFEHAAQQLATSGGVIQLGPRNYRINRTIVLPPNVTLRGRGSHLTRIALPGGSGVKPPYVAITGERDFTVEDLRITATHAPVLICAPTFVPESFGAAQESEKVGSDGTRTRNVVVRRCELNQELLGGAMRRSDKDQLAKLYDYMTHQPQHVHGWQGIVTRGDGVRIEECIVEGGGTAVSLNRTTQAHVVGCTLRAGASGQALIAYSHLDWPDAETAARTGNPGAKIEGSYCYDLRIEANDCAARCTTSRNLVNIMRGGVNVNVIDNHIHDIQSTTDSEALLFHLWFARWPTPRLKMTGPTTGTIIDSEGEVANEDLNGAAIDIVEGRGVGQMRTIVKHEGSTVELDQPWHADPDMDSVTVFTAPPPFRRLVIAGNTIERSPINLILWGNTHDVIVDGNTTSDGPGLTVWSVRYAGDQKVWGGAAWTLVANNRMQRCFADPQTKEETLDDAVGFFVRCSRAHDCTDIGYDMLGLIVRDNLAQYNTGLAFRHTYAIRGADGTPQPWRINDAGIVFDHNAIADSPVGVSIQNGSNAIERGTMTENVTFPMSWVDG